MESEVIDSLRAGASVPSPACADTYSGVLISSFGKYIFLESTDELQVEDDLLTIILCAKHFVKLCANVIRMVVITTYY